MNTTAAALPPAPAPAHSTEVLCTYSLLVDETHIGGIVCESYGLAISDRQTGREAQLRRFTLRLDTALSLLSLLARHQVSPLHLQDVVEDYLAEQEA